MTIVLRIEVSCAGVQASCIQSYAIANASVNSARSRKCPEFQLSPAMPKYCPVGLLPEAV